MTVAYQRDRIYKLTVGDYKSGKGIEITDLQIRFDCNKSSDNKKKSNSSAVEVYNLSQRSLQLLQSDFISCTLEVGYKDTGLVMLLKGNVTSLNTTKQGNDTITRIQIGEGYVDLNHVKLKMTIPPGKTQKEIVKELTKQMPGISEGAFAWANMDSPIPFGYPLHGSPADMMDELGEAWRLEWRVSNGKMEVSDENGLVSKNKNEAPVISAASGLIDIPFYTSGESTKTKKDTTRRVGLQFKALLNPDLVPGKLVRVESFSTAVVSKNANGEVKPIQGWYRIHSAKYTGDFRGNDWYVECFCTIVLEDDFK